MSRLTAIAVTAAALCVGLVACGGDDEGADTAATTEQATPATTPLAGEAPAAPGTEVKTASSEFGTILFDGADRAIYLFEKEKSDTSECYGECATAWPPVLTEGEPQAGSGAKVSLLGTTERRDRSTQVTYNGHPLYYYVDDPPKQVLCHDVVEFGGLWLVVKPNGDAVPPA
jgi:predicted lipoprotein with Yx(FWY)xxD motif